MNNMLIFIPQLLHTKRSGYLLGKVIYDTRNDLKKFYVITLREVTSVDLIKSTLDVIGYYSNVDDANEEIIEYKHPHWIHIVMKPSKTSNQGNKYHLMSIIFNNKKMNLSAIRTIMILYDQQVLYETELFESEAESSNHFHELVRLIQNKKDELTIKSRFVCIWETLLTYHMFLYLYPVQSLSKVTERLLPILKYSSLGLHIYDWLENIKWMLAMVIQNKNFKLKTGNYALAIMIDIALGIFVLQLLQYYIKESPSQLLLNNAEASLNILERSRSVDMIFMI